MGCGFLPARLALSRHAACSSHHARRGILLSCQPDGGITKRVREKPGCLWAKPSSGKGEKPLLAVDWDLPRPRAAQRPTVP